MLFGIILWRLWFNVLFNYFRLLVLYYRVKSSSYNALTQELRRQLVFVSSAGRKLCHIISFLFKNKKSFLL